MLFSKYLGRPFFEVKGCHTIKEPGGGWKRWKKIIFLYDFIRASTKVLKRLNQCFEQLRSSKVSPARQLLIQQVGFVNSRHFFQHRSRAKHGFKNLVILESLHNTVCPKMAKFCLRSYWMTPDRYDLISRLVKWSPSWSHWWNCGFASLLQSQ